MLASVPYDALRLRKRAGQCSEMPLHWRTIAPATNNAYLHAVVCFTMWLDYHHWCPVTIQNLNFWLCVYMEYLFANQLPKHLAVRLLCGIQHFSGLKSAAFALPWNAVKAWNKLHRSHSVLPMPVSLKNALIAIELHYGNTSLAILWAETFDCLVLRQNRRVCTDDARKEELQHKDGRRRLDGDLGIGGEAADEQCS